MKKKGGGEGGGEISWRVFRGAGWGLGGNIPPPTGTSRISFPPKDIEGRSRRGGEVDRLGLEKAEFSFPPLTQG